MGARTVGPSSVLAALSAASFIVSCVGELAPNGPGPGSGGGAGWPTSSGGGGNGGRDAVGAGGTGNEARCGDECPGECLAGHCSVVVTTGPQLAGPIAVNGTHVYLATSADILRVGLDGTGLTTLATDRWVVLTLALDDEHVYWAEGQPGSGSIMRLPLAGGASEELAPSLIVNQIVMDATHMYWPDRPDLNSGSIVRAPRAGGAPETLTTGQGGPVGIAVDADSVYWTNFRGTVMKMPLAGGAPTELASEASDSTGPASIAIDESWVYWTHSGGSGTVRRVPIAGGEADTLATGQDWPQDLVVSDGYLYWTNSGDGGGGAVMKMSVRGGPAERIAVGPGPSGLAVDASHVYWTDWRTGAVTATTK